MVVFQKIESLLWICFLPYLLAANANAKQTSVEHSGKLSCHYNDEAAKRIPTLIVVKGLWEKKP